MKLVPVDHDPFADAPAGPSAGAKLVPVDHDPFADPASVQDAPAAGVAGSDAAAVGRGIINGVPVVGPYLLGGLNRAAAGIRSLKNDTKFSDELATVERFGQRTAAESPKSAIGGELVGGVVGTAPLVAAAPAAFGVGAGSLGARSVAGAISGGVLGGADSAVRSGGDLEEIKTGGALGAALGGAGPAIGRGVGKVVTAIRGEAPGMPLLREAVEGFSEAELASAQHLRDQALALPGGRVDLSVGEALNAATGGRANRASQLERVVANSGGRGGQIASEVYAARPASVDNAARGAFEAVAPSPQSTTALGFDLQGAARAGIAQTPEGMALAQAREAVGPRTSADRAGQVIQQEMTGVRTGREAVRSLQADQDYATARGAPERFGIERTIRVERAGEPVITQPEGSPRFTDAAPRPMDLPPVIEASAAAGPESLARFVARHGGLRLDGDVLATDLHRFNIPGVGNVARESGKGIDNFWRERLIEAGYLRADADGGAARDITNELLRKLQNEQRGLPSYPIDAERQAASARGRQGQVTDEFRAAQSQAESSLDEALSRAGVPPESLHPEIRSRTVGALMRGEQVDPLDAYERTVAAMREPPAPYVRGTTVTEEIPEVRFVQVNPQAALDAAAQQGRSAKGDIRPAIDGFRRDLFEGRVDPASGVRELDGSVEGLLHLRERTDQQIQAALRDGDATKVRDLSILRSTLDADLKRLPEVATADANFAANSRPLEPFQGDAPLARVTRQDPVSGRMLTPTEEVPSHLRGASAARELLANATPEARTAYGNRLATQILDGATDKRGAIDPDRLNGLLRENADVLEQMPEVYARLEGVVRARDGLDRVLASPLGRIAEQPDVKRAISAVFSSNPLPGSAREISEAMTALARNNPAAARELARVHLEGVFNEATQQQRGVAAQYGGAGFASAVRGNAQQRQNLEAVVRALPEGDTLWTGLDRMLTTLEATGYRPQKGSDTAFNGEILKRFASGKTSIGQAISDVATGAAAGATVGGAAGGAAGGLVGLRRSAGDAMTRASMLGQGEALARLMFDPRALPDLRALSKSPAGSKNAELFTRRLLVLANGGAAPLRQPVAK